jgi:hypothetical protein
MTLDSNSPLGSLISIPYFDVERSICSLIPLGPTNLEVRVNIVGQLSTNQITWDLAISFPFFGVFLVRVFTNLFKNSIGLGFS